MTFEETDFGIKVMIFEESKSEIADQKQNSNTKKIS